MPVVDVHGTSMIISHAKTLAVMYKNGMNGGTCIQRDVVLYSCGV